MPVVAHVTFASRPALNWHTVASTIACSHIVLLPFRFRRISPLSAVLPETLGPNCFNIFQHHTRGIRRGVRGQKGLSLGCHLGE